MPPDTFAQTELCRSRVADTDGGICPTSSTVSPPQNAAAHDDLFCIEPQAPRKPSLDPPAFLSLPLWTIDETAAYLRVEPQTIRKAISTLGHYHGLRPQRFGRRWRFKAAVVRAAVEGA